MKPHWRIREIDDAAARSMAGSLGLSLPITSLLCARGINGTDEADRFLDRRFSAIPSPFLMKGMAAAVDRIRGAIEHDEQIGIFSDSDMDGLTALTLLRRVLGKMGVHNDPYTRYPIDKEEYGLSESVIREFADKGVTLIITLDSGMRDVREIACAGTLGMDVIVCDHHEEGPEKPAAIIVNPKQTDCDYPFKELAGVGVAFKLGHALLMSSLQRFGKRWVLVARDGDALWALPVHDRIAGDAVCLDDPSGIRTMAGPADTVVLFGMNGEVQNVKDVCPGPDVLSFESLAGMPLEKACAAWGIRVNPRLRRIELAAEAFLEYDFNLSPKLRDYIASLCDLVALGTIADIMPLRGENRTLVYHGLRALAVTPHPGMARLLRRIEGGASSKNVAWSIAPLLNTPGRFGRADLTADFFLIEKPDEIVRIIEEIYGLNAERKSTLNGLYDTCLAEVRSGRYRYGRHLVFVEDDSIPEGLCGLLANRLADALNRPVIVVSLAGGKTVVKGSGRAKGNYNFMARVSPFSSMFEKFGGHAQAFGFSVDAGKLPRIKEALAAAIDGESYRHGEEDLLIDLELPVVEVTSSLVSGFALLEPFGNRNEEPVFLSRGVQIRNFQRFGEGKKHGKYLVKENGGVEVIGWNMADLMEKKAHQGAVDMAYRLENNSFNGSATPRMMLIDVD